MMCTPYPDEIISDIKMMRSAGPAKYLVVEGETDAQFFSRIVPFDYDRIYVTMDKSKSLEIREKMSPDIDDVMFVVDVDYDSLNGNNLECPNLAYTDHHDLEVILIGSSALKKFLDEYCSAPKLKHHFNSSHENLKNKVFELAKHVGYARWANSRHSWSISFEGMDFGRFIDRRKMELSQDNLVTLLCARSKKPSLVKTVDAEIKKLAKLGADIHLVACGKDALEILGMYSQNMIGSVDSKHICSENIGRLFRMGIERHEFAETQLFQKIHKWSSH